MVVNSSIHRVVLCVALTTLVALPVMADDQYMITVPEMPLTVIDGEFNTRMQRLVTTGDLDGARRMLRSQHAIDRACGIASLVRLEGSESAPEVVALLDDRGLVHAFCGCYVATMSVGDFAFRLLGDPTLTAPGEQPADPLLSREALLAMAVRCVATGLAASDAPRSRLFAALTDGTLNPTQAASGKAPPGLYLRDVVVAIGRLTEKEDSTAFLVAAATATPNDDLILSVASALSRRWSLAAQTTLRRLSSEIDRVQPGLGQRLLDDQATCVAYHELLQSMQANQRGERTEIALRARHDDRLRLCAIQHPVATGTCIDQIRRQEWPDVHERAIATLVAIAGDLAAPRPTWDTWACALSDLQLQVQMLGDSDPRLHALGGAP